MATYTPSAAAVAATRPQNRIQTFAERNFRLLAELLLIVPAYALYQMVRSAVGGEAGDAFENASVLIEIEQRLGIFHEAFLQQLILPQTWMVDVFNYIYIWGHLPVIIAVAVWLYTQHRENYSLFRNAFMISGLIALIGFTAVPLTPPRYMPEFGFVDTIIHAQSYYLFQSPKIVNQYAAMPSLHFGWDLLVAFALLYNARAKWLRGVAMVMPFFTLSGIVLTANHYFLDAAAGALVACLGFGIAWQIRKTVNRRDGVFGFLT